MKCGCEEVTSGRRWQQRNGKSLTVEEVLAKINDDSEFDRIGRHDNEWMISHGDLLTRALDYESPSLVRTVYNYIYCRKDQMVQEDQR